MRRVTAKPGAVLVLLATGSLAAVALAGCVPPKPQPSPSPSESDSAIATPADPLPLEQLPLFSGVARLQLGSNCTGTVVDTGVDDAPAYLLTNGHCAGDLGRPAQTVTVGEDWIGTVDFFAAAESETLLTVESEVLEYSTMRGRDLAIVRLDHTLGELRELGVRPVEITDAEPASGADVTNVGVPVQNLDPEDWVLRRGDCTLGEQHTLIEFEWLWFDSWANDCPGIISGSSGSPLFALDDDGAPAEIVAMINTTTWGVTRADGGACAIHRPCQVTADGTEFVERTSYAVTVAGVNRCFGTDGRFALGGECPLELSSVWSVAGGGSAFRGGELPDAAGRLPSVSLAGREVGTVRTALVPLGDARACTAEASYAGAESHPLPVLEHFWQGGGLTLPVALPETEGHFALCAVAGDDYAGAATVLFQVDRTPPIMDAGVSVEHIGEGAVWVMPHTNPPEIATNRLLWGPPDTTDCSDTDAFEIPMLFFIAIEADNLPARLCVVGVDTAGNETPVLEVEVPRQE